MNETYRIKSETRIAPLWPEETTTFEAVDEDGKIVFGVEVRVKVTKVNGRLETTMAWAGLGPNTTIESAEALQQVLAVALPYAKEQEQAIEHR